MADEIAQVVELEYKGAYYLFKGTKEMIALMVRSVKALSDRHHRKYLDKPGCCKWKKMQEISNGTPPILEFPKEMFEEKTKVAKSGEWVRQKSEFDRYCEKYGLRFCIMPDLNPEDDYIPVAVPAQDVGIHKEQIKAVMERRILREEQKDKSMEERITKAREDMENAVTEEQRKKAKEELSMLFDEKTENADLLKESKQKMEHDNEIDFAEYLKQGEGTLFETDPDAALKQENACGFVREYMPYECMWPVRDEDHVPESGEVFYSQTTEDEKIHMIKREFKKDDSGHIYSEYKVKIPDSTEVKVYSDYGMDKERWKKQLPVLLREAGLLNEQKTAVVTSEERFKKYRRYLEENFREASPGKAAGEAVSCSSPEAEAFIHDSNESVLEKKDYEESRVRTISVPLETLMPDEEEILCLQAGDDLVKGVELSGVNGNAAEIGLYDEKNYPVFKPDGSRELLTGAALAEKLMAGGRGAFPAEGKGRRMR